MTPVQRQANKQGVQTSAKRADEQEIQEVFKYVSAEQVRNGKTLGRKSRLLCHPQDIGTAKEQKLHNHNADAEAEQRH